MYCCTVNVHALGTSNMHQKERRNFVYAEKCLQCHKQLEDDYVAAHIVSYHYAFINPWVGKLNLQTTCKRCNSKNQAGKKYDSDSFYFSWISCHKTETLEYVCHPWCFHWKYKTPTNQVISR